MANVLVNFKCVRLLFTKVNIASNFKPIRRSIMTSEFRAAEALEELKNNPYFEKYSKKIASLQQTSPEEFLSRLEVTSKTKERKKDSDSDCGSSKPTPKLQNAKSGTLNKAFTKPKLLNDILKIELIKDKNKEQISEIWLEYHKTKDAIAATVPSKTYNLVMSRSEKYPIFLLPLPRNQGYEFIVSQFNGSEVHFTPLIAYQTHKENAPECLTMIFFADLLQDKDLVLMKGEFDKNVLSPIEAQCLANQLQLYYGEENEKRTNLLERFTYEPDSFKHMDLIAELECLTF